MSRKISASDLGFLVVIGSVWGLSEAACGLALESCAKLASGSIMTGVALLFVSAAWARTRRVAGPAFVVAMALAFKLFDALLLGLPVKHGAIANPMFALVTEGLALFIIVSFLADSSRDEPSPRKWTPGQSPGPPPLWKRKTAGQAFLGGMSALLAVNLFPLVKYATGIPACVVSGGAMPLSLYYAPLAVAVSLITVPLGFLIAAKAEAIRGKIVPAGRRWLIPSAAAALCLAVQALIRCV